MSDLRERDSLADLDRKRGLELCRGERHVQMCKPLSVPQKRLLRGIGALIGIVCAVIWALSSIWAFQLTLSASRPVCRISFSSGVVGVLVADGGPSMPRPQTWIGPNVASWTNALSVPNVEFRRFTHGPTSWRMAASIPLWIVLVLCVAAFALARRSSGRVVGQCSKCDYDLTGNVSGVCPECGTPVPPRNTMG